MVAQVATPVTLPAPGRTATLPTTRTATPVLAAATPTQPAGPTELPPIRESQQPLTASPAATRLVESPEIIGYSTDGWPIELYRFGHGPVHLALIGGIHGGYEWNTILLAYEMIDHLTRNPGIVPEAVTVYVIPAANPDGQMRTVGKLGRFTPNDITVNTVPGRLNGHDVDLNRNWDCNWQPVGTWLDREISAGAAPFSEVETQVLRDFIINTPVHGVIFWHSAAPGVFAGGCDSNFAASDDLAAAYAVGSGYPFERTFTGYEVTGDATNWLAAQEVAAISVELTTHLDLDFQQNLLGVQEVLAYLTQP